MTILIVVLAALLVCTVGNGGSGSLAQEEGGVAPQAVLTPLLQYQGRLSNPTTGEPVADGDYTMTFRLYDVDSGGSPLWTETEDVSVQGGLFSTVLGDGITPLDQALFNGQALWLGVKVGADAEATPRQQVMPVAYALSLVPGAVVEASSGPVLQVNNTGGGEALSVDGDLNVSGGLTGGSHNHSGAHITSGTVVDAHIASTIARDTEVTSAISAHTGDSDAHHVRYTDAEAWAAVLDNDGSTSGLDADLLDGYQGSALFALDENELVSGRPSFRGGTSGSTPPFYVDSDYLVTDLNADLLDGSHASAFAGASHSHDDYVNVTGDTMNGGLVVLASTSHGISSQTSSSASGAAGVEGKNTGSGYGVLGGSAASHGVYGYSSATSGGYGVYGSGTGVGVYGESTQSHGVYGDGGAGAGDYGGYFRGFSGVAGFGGSGYGGYFNSSSGLALYAAGDAEVTGNLTVDRVAYSSPRTHYFVVGSEGFVPGSSYVDYYNTYGNGGAYIVSGSGAMVAPVHLPQGAVVTEFEVFFYDNSSSDLTVYLHPQGFSGGYGSMASISSSGTPGYSSAVDTTISSATIYNTSYSYSIYAYCSAWDGNNLMIKGAVITYTINEAP